MRNLILIFSLFVVIGCGERWHRNHAGHPHNEVIDDPVSLFCFDAEFVSSDDCIPDYFILENQDEVLFASADDLFNLFPNLTEENDRICLGTEEFELVEFFDEDFFDECEEDDDDDDDNKHHGHGHHNDD